MNVRWLKKVPAQLVVVISAIVLSGYFSLEDPQDYFFNGRNYNLDGRFLVDLPSDMVSVLTFPNFSILTMPAAWGYVIMFALVGSIESLLVCQAIDVLDPYKRKTNMNRSILVIGIGSLICGFIGGLPMISEVVRSSANIDNGARTRWANIFHGVFLFAFVYFLPTVLERIPLSALAAMLVFTGYRLAAPKHFIISWREGHEQFLIFIVTIGVTITTDLLMGIGAGILVNLLFHFARGANFRTLFKPRFDIIERGNQVLFTYHSPAIFTNYLGLNQALEGVSVSKDIVIDFQDAQLLDHTTQERLRDLGIERQALGGSLNLIGLENHRGVANHPLSTKVRASR
jgi:MFS superfamily sulfate permease-like transporter